MAKFVIAGKANCPYYAKAELLGDTLSRNLSEFRVHKILIDPKDWDDWLKEICKINDWKHSKSPIIWRELVDRGGKGMYLGDANDFQEYAKNFYGVESELTSEDLKKISQENQTTHTIIEKEKIQILDSIDPLNLTISNPESPVLYYIMNEILNSNAFGTREIFVRLYSKNKSGNLEGIRMEIIDLASPKLRNIKIVDTAEEAFKNCDFTILLDDLELIEEYNDTKKYSNPYIQLSKDIDQYAKQTCKILISPFYSRNQIYALVNIFSHQMTRINPKKNLLGNSMGDEMLAKAILAHRLNINPSYVSNVVMMGQSFDSSFYIDLTYGRVTDYDGAVWAATNTHWLNLVSMIADKSWINKEFLKLVHERDSLISENLKRNAILTFAQSIDNLVKLWNINHKNDNSLYSAIVYAKGNYTIKDDVFISVPVKFENGSFFFIKNFSLNNNTQSVLSEIIEDTKRRLKNFKEDMYITEGHEIKLSIPHVIY